jgi:hypothetical protein
MQSPPLFTGNFGFAMMAGDSRVPVRCRPHCSARYGQRVGVVRAWLDSDMGGNVICNTDATPDARLRSINSLAFPEPAREAHAANDQK